ncbi:flagellar hook-length control protein FliK [Stutzerimonas stutzeri]|nr:flagellar hook-length control protein FliK [Stutzerimonas stutzeri]MCQ4263225.1 flagellar hook-length control protein FliK [Stutzerimonas stutzeri]
MLQAAADLHADGAPQHMSSTLTLDPLTPDELPELTETSVDEVAEQDAAEQWLLSMLDQQQVVVQAREAISTGLPAALPFAAAQAEAATASLGESAEQRPAYLGAPLPAVQLEGHGERFAEHQSGSVAVLRAAFDRAAPPSTPAPDALLLSLEQDSALPVEHISALVDAGEGHETAILGGERPAGSGVQVAERLIKLQGPDAKWGEQMLHALREHVEVQLQQRQQSATIRLDPPELGSLEIHLSHDAGRLTVQLSAANADVARLLQQTSDRLRQELVAQHFVQVNVQVGADGQSGRQGQSRQSEHGEDVLASAAAPGSNTTPVGGSGRSVSRTNDVLVTV